MILTIETFRGQYPELPSGFLVRLDTALDRLNRRRKVNVTVTSTDYIVVETDEVVVYTGAGGQTTYLPNATAYDGYTFNVKHAGTGVLTVDATNNGQIFSSLGLTNTITLATGDGIDFAAANGAWQII